LAEDEVDGDEINSKLKMQNQNSQQEIFCTECGSIKKTKYCEICKKETPNLYKKELKETIKVNAFLEGGMKRGDLSWAYFSIAYGILLSISVGIIQIIDFLMWYHRIVLILIIAFMWFYLCFFNAKFKKFLVRFFNKSKNLVEKFKT